MPQQASVSPQAWHLLAAWLSSQHLRGSSGGLEKQSSICLPPVRALTFISRAEAVGSQLGAAAELAIGRSGACAVGSAVLSSES